MSSITQIFLGIMLVGLVMSMKVIMDGLQAVTLLKDKITALRIAIQDAKTQLLVQENENKEIEATLQEIKAEVDKLSEKEKEIDSEIKTLRTDFS